MTDRQLPNEFGAALSQLIDTDIQQAIGQSKDVFLNADIYSSDRVKQTSYELTLLDGRNLNFSPLGQCKGSALSVHLELPAYNVVKDGVVEAVVINPWQCCLIRTREQIALPDNVQGKVLARGQLFQMGLIVESTYIDPGFCSSEDRPGVHLMIFNATQRAITLTAKEPVARLELFRLAKDVAHPHGGAGSITQTEHALDLWPWPEQLGSAAEESKRAYLARDKGARLIAMDRQAHALKLLIDQVDGLKKSKDEYKLFLYIFFPWLLWLVFKSLNLEHNIAGDALKVYSEFRVWINGGLFWILVVIAPIFLTSIKKDARDTVMRLLKQNAKE